MPSPYSRCRAEHDCIRSTSRWSSWSSPQHRPSPVFCALFISARPGGPTPARALVPLVARSLHWPFQLKTLPFAPDLPTDSPLHPFGDRSSFLAVLVFWAIQTTAPDIWSCPLSQFAILPPGLPIHEHWCLEGKGRETGKGAEIYSTPSLGPRKDVKPSDPRGLELRPWASHRYLCSSNLRFLASSRHWQTVSGLAFFHHPSDNAIVTVSNSSLTVDITRD